eukprot:TRINITY_DN12072_c0_g1_i1.p1 TRINITY_DN12072_c0_g1~~TRINITY_DN12072_c0_g1_i1.p1  ORF type:complete len:374 (-),score=56.15 TRINITY_DN12072_c0_g1_i1:718-1815(-)
MRLSALRAGWDRMHRINNQLTEQMVNEYIKPPVHRTKLHTQDMQRMYEFSRQNKHLMEPENSLLDKWQRDGTFDPNLADRGPQEVRTNLSYLPPSEEAKNCWLSPFSWAEIGQPRRVAHGSSFGNVYSTTVMVMVGNGRGVAGLGYGKGSAQQQCLSKALTQAFKNLVVVEPDTFTIPYPLKFRFQSVRMELQPHHTIHAISPIADAIRMFGYKGMRVAIFTKNPDVRVAMRCFFLAMAHIRSHRELALGRGLLAQGTYGAARRTQRYIEEVRLKKGMYSVAPPVTDRNSAADRWKWNVHREHVSPLPNFELAAETLFSLNDMAKEESLKRAAAAAESAVARSEAAEIDLTGADGFEEPLPEEEA